MDFFQFSEIQRLFKAGFESKVGTGTLLTAIDARFYDNVVYHHVCHCSQVGTELAWPVIGIEV